jgi:hypothetical protein
MWFSSPLKDGKFLCRCYICCNVVSAQGYPRCHSVQVVMDSVRPLSLHCSCTYKVTFMKMYSGFLVVQACAVGYA